MRLRGEHCGSALKALGYTKGFGYVSLRGAFPEGKRKYLVTKQVRSSVTHILERHRGFREVHSFGHKMRALGSESTTHGPSSGTYLLEKTERLQGNT